MKKTTIFLTLIIIAAIGLRIYAPLADLPPDISISGSVYTDEGNQCHNSRSKALFGNWYEDDWQITRYNPVLPYFKYAIFKFFGVGFLQVRSVSIFFTILTLLFSFLIFRSYFTDLFALIGTAMIGLNFFILMYGKIGTFETPMIFWMILTLYFIEKYRTSAKSIFLFLGGASAFTTFIFKNISAYFIPVPIVAYILIELLGKSPKSLFTKKHLKNIIIASFGIISVFVLWYTLFYIPNKEWIMSAPGKYIGNQVIPKSIEQAIGNFFAFNWKEQFFKIPIIWLMSVLYLPFFYRKLILKKSDITDTAFTAFFLSHTFFFMFMNHRPTRYLLPVIFAMIFMSLKLFEDLYNKKKGLAEERVSTVYSLIFLILDTLWLIIAIFFCISPLLFKYFGIFSVNSISFKLILLSFLLSAIINFFPKIKEINLNNKIKKPVVISLIILSFGFNLYYFKKWDDNKTFTVLKINRDLKRDLNNAFIAGLTAPVSVLESRNRSLFLFPNFVNWDNSGTDKDTFMRYPITHALLASFNHEISLYFDAWPNKMENAKLLKNYNVKEQFLHFYSFEFPYIEKTEKLEDNKYKLFIKNASSKINSVYVNTVYMNNLEKIKASDIIIKSRKIKINTGNIRRAEITSIIMNTDKDLLENAKILIFNLEKDEKKIPLRYEGEKFPGRTGENIKLKGLSGNFARYFNGKKHGEGFVLHGPYVPFEYTRGFIKLDFNIRVDKITNPISPVCEIDFYDKNKEKSIAKRILIPKRDGMINGKFINHSLFVYLPETTKVEFRVKVLSKKNPKMKLYIDFVDITYYQSKAVLIKD